MKLKVIKDETQEKLTITLRKVGLDLLPLIMNDLPDQEKAVFYIKPEGRNPEEVKALFDSLEVDSQLEIITEGWELNESNVKKLLNQQKKFHKATGQVDREEMMKRLLTDPEVMQGLVAQAAKEVNSETSLQSSSENATTIPSPESTATPET